MRKCVTWNCAAIAMLLVVSTGDISRALSSCEIFSINWLVYDSASPLVEPGSLPYTNTFSVAFQKQVSREPATMRSSGYKPGMIQVSAFDSGGAEIARDYVFDARPVHFDQPGPVYAEGKYHLSETGFLVELPADPAISTIKFYELLGTETVEQVVYLGQVSVTIQ